MPSSVSHGLGIVLAMPGEGPDPVINFDRGRLLELVKAELKPLIAKAMSARKLPPLKPSTIERKRRAGYSNPAQPLVGTGALERSIKLVEDPDGSFRIEIDWYVFVIDRKWHRALMPQAEVDAAVDRAVAKFLRKV